jgi:hypothetical protein
MELLSQKPTLSLWTQTGLLLTGQSEAILVNGSTT